MAQPTKRKFRVQQPVSLVTPPLLNVATQDARPALSEQENEDFGRKRDIGELQIDDEAEEFTLSGEQHIEQTSPDVNLLEPHEQKCEVLNDGIPVCQQAAAGLGMNDLRIKWSNQPHSVEDCFNIMFPQDYFNHVIDLTNANLPVSIRNFTKHEFMQCIGVLLTTALVNPVNIKNLWNTQENRLVPPFRMKDRFGLGRDRFLDWKAHLRLAVLGILSGQ